MAGVVRALIDTIPPGTRREYDCPCRTRRCSRRRGMIGSWGFQLAGAPPLLSWVVRPLCACHATCHHGKDSRRCSFLSSPRCLSPRFCPRRTDTPASSCLPFRRSFGSSRLSRSLPRLRWQCLLSGMAHVRTELLEFSQHCLRRLLLPSCYMKWPNHALQRTAAGRRGCNRRASWPPSLSLGR